MKKKRFEAVVEERSEEGRGSDWRPGEQQKVSGSRLE